MGRPEDDQLLNGGPARYWHDQPRQRQDIITMEKRFVTKEWSVCFNIAIWSQCPVNAMNGWTNVLGKKGELKPSIHELGMELIARGRSRLRGLLQQSGGGSTRGRPLAYLTLPAVALRSLRRDQPACLRRAERESVPP